MNNKLFFLFLFIILLSIIYFIQKENKNIFPSKRKKRVKFGKIEVKEFFKNTVPTTHYMHNKIKGSNYYTTDYNSPNFVSNVMDLRNFYSYENTDGNILNFNKKLINPNHPYETAKMATSFSQETPETWHYHNELPMNGGYMGNVVGMDDISTPFAGLNTEQHQFKKIPKTDDLRNGMGYPNEQRQIINNVQN